MVISPSVPICAEMASLRKAALAMASAHHRWDRVTVNAPQLKAAMASVPKVARVTVKANVRRCVMGLHARKASPAMAIV